MLHIALDFGVVNLATKETLGVEDSVLGVGVERILRRITNQTFIVREADP